MGVPTIPVAPAWQAGADVRAHQRRAVPVLLAAQTVAGLGTGAALPLGSLVAYEVTGNEGLAGISRVIGSLSTAVFAVPLATFAVRVGRRSALTVGWLLGILGAVLLILSVAWHSLWLLMIGMLVFGGASAAGLQTRFAATDMAEPHYRARTLSWVVWGATIGSVIGPNLAALGRGFGRWLQIPEIGGIYGVAVAGLLLAAIIAWIGLRPDPMRVAQAHGESPRTQRRTHLIAVLRRLWASPMGRFSLVTVVCNQMVMVAVMTLTPVHMRHTHSLEAIGVTISLHIAGMFAFSPMVGWLVDRWGARWVIACCVCINFAALATCFFAGHHLVLIDVGLFLLGLGWSFGHVAGSALLVDSVTPDIRTPAQGAMDTATNLGAALAAGTAGPVLASLGYGGLAVVTAALLIPIIILVSLARPTSATGRLRP